MVRAQRRGKTWWHLNRRRIGVLRAPRKCAATSPKNHVSGQLMQAHGETHQGKWEKDHPRRQRRGCPQKEGIAPHDRRTSCGQMEASHGSSGQVLVQDGNSPCHKGAPQCGRTPHRGGQQCQRIVMWGKNGFAGGKKARGGASTPQDAAKHSARKGSHQRCRDSGRKEAPHEGKGKRTHAPSRDICRGREDRHKQRKR